MYRVRVPEIIVGGVYHRIPVREDGYFDATAMCTSVGKQLKNFNRNIGTDAFVEALSAQVHIPVIALRHQQGGRNGTRHTWVHPQVAAHLGQWLSAEFAVWVSTIVLNSRQLEERVQLHFGCPVLYYGEIAGTFDNVCVRSKAGRGLETPVECPVECDKTGSTDDGYERNGKHNSVYGNFRMLRTVPVRVCSGAETAWRDLLIQHGLLVRGRHARCSHDNLELVLRKPERRAFIFALMDQAAAMYPVVDPEVELARQATLQEQAKAEQERARLEQSRLECEPSTSAPVVKAARRPNRRPSAATKEVPPELAAFLEGREGSLEKYKRELGFFYDTVSPDVPFVEMKVWLERHIDAAVEYAHESKSRAKATARGNGSRGDGFYCLSCFTTACKAIGKPELASRFVGNVPKGRPRKQ